jgi:cytoskeleton protein RodZ
MTDFPGAGPAGAATPGVLLAAARKASGLSVGDVAAQMRIAPRQVEAIEADRYDQLPGAVFVRGFVRNYARLLKIDPVPLLHALEPALGDDAPLRAQHYAGTLPVPVKHNHTKLWLAILAVVVAVIVAAGAYEYLRARRDSGETPSEPAKPAPATPAPAPAPPVEGGEPVPLAPGRVPETSRTPKESDLGLLRDAGGPVSAAPALPVPLSAHASRLDRMTLEFVQDSWFELRDRSGKALHMGTGTAGSAQRFEAEGPLNVVFGNAPGVRITYNEKPVDLSAYSSRNVARFTLE